MNEKLDALYDFLLDNRRYNVELQEKFSRIMIGNSEFSTDRLTSLLYHVVNTQSQPKIDLLSIFFKMIFNNTGKLDSFEAFIKLLNGSKINFEGLYESLKGVRGWGPKTAALFVKYIYLIHNVYEDESLKIWEDVPKNFQEQERFYLPVDSVILAIFTRLNGQRSWSFDSVNRVINDRHREESIEVWDDLWFWGFINQNGSGENRIFEWNESKYWILNETDKNSRTINEIKSKSADFRKILEE